MLGMMKMSMEKNALLRSPADDRNYGIDLLRIVSICMIITLHILYHGGVLSYVPRFSVKFVTAWFLEMAAYGSVNVFAIISGYVYYGRKTRYSNLLQLYIQMLFYTVLCTSAFLLFSPDKVSKQTIVYCLIPFKIDGYWFFSAYFCLFLFIPFINSVIDRLNEKNAVKLLLSGFVVFSVIPTILYQDIGGLSNGYSVSWLAMMYVVGACIRKFESRLQRRRWLLYYLLNVTASLAGKLAIEGLTQVLLGQPKYGVLFSAYISPFIVLSSVFLFLFFKDIKLNTMTVRLIGFFAPTTFGVYLIHMEPLIRTTLIDGRFRGLAEWTALLMIGGVILSAFGIWIVCSLIDRLRILIFRLLRIPSLCEQAVKQLRRIARLG